LAKISTFKAIRPVRDKVHLVASRAFYSYKRNVLNAKLQSNPYTFIHIINPEFNKKDKTEPNTAERFHKVREMYDSFHKDGIFLQDRKESLYLYRHTSRYSSQLGIIAGASIDDYFNGVIKVHEATLTQREDMFKMYLEVCNFNAEPVLMTYPDSEEASSVYQKYTRTRPEYEFSTTDQIKHELWVISKKEDVDKIKAAFSKMDSIYIADGHHRSSSSALYGLDKRKANPDFTGEEDFNYFMAYFIPESELMIYDFNRIVKDLNGLSPEEFLEKIEVNFSVRKKGRKLLKPEAPHHISMFLNGNWYSLIAKKDTYDPDDPIGSLDAYILSKNLLDPVLGITDPKTDERVSFVGGPEGMKGLRKATIKRECMVAFGLYPVSTEQLKAVADAGKIMPPKSTWIAPKLRSGFTIYEMKNS
jgi:uncharacterized protein (DUF1015 family)